MKRLLSFGIGAALGAAIIWFIRRSLPSASNTLTAPDMQSVAPMTAPVITAPSPSSNGSHANGKPTTIKTNIVSVRPPRPAYVETDEPKAVEETAPVAQTTRAESDSDVAVPDAPVVDAPTQAESHRAAKDDFNIIYGIGEYFKQKLYDAGITTFQELADAPLDVLEEQVGLAAWRIEKDEIKEQALTLARGGQITRPTRYRSDDESDAQESAPTSGS